MRPAHILETSSKTKLPKRVIYYDSESQVNTEISDDEIRKSLERKEGHPEIEEPRKEHSLYLICATFRDEKRREKRRYIGEDAGASFWTDVHMFTLTTNELLLIAHNAKYDVQVTGGVYYLVKLGYQCTHVSDNNPFIVCFEKKEQTKSGKEIKRKIRLISSTNYYQASLKQLGKTFGLPKLEFAYHVDPRTDPALMEEAITYCERDVEILETAIEHFFSFVKREKLGKLSYTAAGQSLQAFRARFMQHEIYIHDDAKALAVERRAYAGGRNEVFLAGRTIDRPIFYVDINSMYPHVMHDNFFPTRLIHFWKTADLSVVEQMIKNGRLVCCDCRVRTDKPVFHKKMKKLIFPIKQFTTTLSTPEILFGIQRGYIEEVWNVCIYEGEKIFSNYVDHFYKARLEARTNGDDVLAYFYKIFMNSLYGKFGQKNIVMERVGDAADPYEIGIQVAIEDGQLKYYKIFGGGIFVEKHDEDDLEAYNSFPAIAAHVTAYARMLLLYYIEIAGWEHVYYCDTDSLFVDADGYQSLFAENALDNKKLGKLKLEEIIDGGITFYGCKDYEYYKSKFVGNDPVTGESNYKRERVWKIKGVSKGARPLGADADGKLQFAITQWGGFTERLKQKDFLHYYNTIRIKKLRREYDKGIVSESGRVIPFEIEQEESSMKNLEKYDYILELCKQIGYIRVPKEGERYYGEYVGLSRVKRAKYFRIGKGLRLDEWCDEAKMTINDILDYLR